MMPTILLLWVSLLVTHGFLASAQTADPVADIHFTPGAPLGVLGGVGFIF
jgi:hypothetical protein